MFLSSFSVDWPGAYGFLSSPTPPYFLTVYTPNSNAYTVNLGSPTFQLESLDGSGPQIEALNWTIITASSGKALVSMVDGGGGQGTVQSVDIGGLTANASGECVDAIDAMEPQSNAPSTLIVQANSTTVQACDFLKVDITGGTPPYNLTILHVGYYFELIQLDPQDVGFVYINRFELPAVLPLDRTVVIPVASGTELYLYVTDSAGNNITSSEITSIASPDTSCPGLPSPGTSLTKTTGDITQIAPGSQELPRGTIDAIAGAAVGGVALLVVIAVVFVVWRRRQAARTPKLIFSIDDDIDTGSEAKFSQLGMYYAVQPFEQTPSEYGRLESGLENRKGPASWNLAGALVQPSVEIQPQLFPGDTDSRKGAPEPPAEETTAQTAPDPDPARNIFGEDQEEDDGDEENMNPTMNGSVIVIHHRDAGAVRRRILDIPPAYGEQMSVSDVADGGQRLC